MSLETWKKEFYPINAEEITDPLQAILHGIRKWRGLRQEHRAAHKLDLKLYDGWVHPALLDHLEFEDFEINADTCALCHNFYQHNSSDNSHCKTCPLALYLGHACDGVKFTQDKEGEEASPYSYFWDTGDPEPMIAALEETLWNYCLGRIELSLEDGFENIHPVYCTKCLTPTIQIVRPGDFRCSQCGGA